MITPPPLWADILERDRQGRFTGKISIEWGKWLGEWRSSSDGAVDEAAFSDPGNRAGSLAQSIDAAEASGIGAMDSAGPTRASLEDLQTLAAFAIANAAAAASVETEQLLASFVPVRPGSGLGFIQDTAANAALYPAAGYPDGSLRRETDTVKMFQALAGAWVQLIAPEFLPFLSAAATHGALKRSGAGLVVRVGDDSADSFLKVLDDAYGAGWDGSSEVPTKNAVYDRVETKADAQAPGAHTVTLAKLTSGGTTGSITWNAQGVITAFVDPT